MGVSIKPQYVVGYKYTNKQGLNLEVVKYEGRKKITVRFEIDGEEKLTTGSYIKKLLPMHSTHGKHFVGEKFPCHDGDIVEVVHLHSQTHATVKWLSDGATAKKDFYSLKLGHNRHPTKNVPKVGDVFESKNYGTATVVEFRDAVDVLVQFEDGAMDSFPVHRLQTGNFRHPSCGLSIGSKHTTKSGWGLEVLEYKDAWNVRVRWQDGSESWESSGSIRLGSIKPAMQPSVEGIGYLGVGQFTSGLKNTANKAPEKIYAYWVRMFSRCYNPYELNKDKNKSYRNIHINPKWHNFQNFAEWAVKQYNSSNMDFELDKDLLCNGIKEYNEATCCFVPAEINLFLMRQDKGKYYRGVNVVMPQHPNAAVGYIARCCTDKGREYLGFYSTPEEAFYAYKERKEEYAKELAEKWKDQIDPRAYLALTNYTVEITD